ncbi:hypothetical protein AAAX72_06885 [Collinsella sp. CLA-ER-H8]
MAGFIWANVISTTKGPGAFVVVFCFAVKTITTFDENRDFAE